MEWTPDAENALGKIPFFVRRRVRARVEQEAAESGRSQVTLNDVRATQKRFLSGMEKEVRGYRIETCFGPGGCPRRAVDSDGLQADLDALLKEADLLAFLRRRVGAGRLKFHHEFRISLADCPNACSQPQIRDIGIVGACSPEVTDRECSGCGACEDACREDAVKVADDGAAPVLDRVRCLHCGQCVPACPTATLVAGRRGYRVMLGGKLGRHPRLARELPGIHSRRAVVDIVRDCLEVYKRNSDRGQRFAALLDERIFREIRDRHPGDPGGGIAGSAKMKGQSEPFRLTFKEENR